METNKLIVYCIYCNKLWTARMHDRLDYISGECPTCDMGDELVGSVEIICDKCNKVVYRKEIESKY